MSRLKAKLERKRSRDRELCSAEGATEKREVSPVVAQLQKKIDRLAFGRRGNERPRETGAHPRAMLPGDVKDTEFGPVLTNTKIYPASYRHGRFLASDFLQVEAGLVALGNDSKLDGFNPKAALFVDTETTGLSGGTGTLPFLVGLGWFEKDGRFVVEQYFSRDPSEEQAGLALFSEKMKAFQFLVSFNGKAFDVPLLNTRFVLHRMRNPGYKMPHLDLLHVARKIFKRRLASCRLGNLESQVLGFEREGDIPGHAIPSAYGSFLRGGPIEPMEAVMEHNALDLVGLAALGGVLEKMYRTPETVEHAVDHLGLARAALLAGEGSAAEKHLLRARDFGSDSLSSEAYCMAAKSASRKDDHGRARDMWLKALEHMPDSGFAHLALAKHLEHRDKDFMGAMDHARKAAAQEGEDQSRKRVMRLERKIQRKLESIKGIENK